MMSAMVRLAIVAAFAALIGAQAAWSHWMEGRPSAVDDCTRRCAITGRTGAMVYRGLDTPKSVYRAVHGECTCS